MPATTLVEIDPITLRERLASGEAVLIDVREPAEYAVGHIAGAVSAPLSALSPDALPKVAPEMMVFNCGVGKRSAMAVAKLQQSGLPVSQHLSGGLAAWKSASLPLVS